MKILMDQDNPILELKSVKGMKLVSLRKILLIKAHKRGSIVYLTDNEIIATNYLLKFYGNFLSVPDFFRCHKSYMINCHYVDCFTYSQVILQNKERIPLSRLKRSLLIEHLIELQRVT